MAGNRKLVWSGLTDSRRVWRLCEMSAADDNSVFLWERGEDYLCVSGHLGHDFVNIAEILVKPIRIHNNASVIAAFVFHISVNVRNHENSWWWLGK